MVAPLLVTVLAASGLTAAAASTAQAAETEITDGTLHWGFRSSFRNYVGRQTAALPPIGALPAGQRITLIAPAAFDDQAAPAWPESPSAPNETLPYLLPVEGGTVTDDGLTARTSGGAFYHFPSHAFEIEVENVTVVADGDTGRLVGDLTVTIPENDMGYPAGSHGGDGVTIGEVAAVETQVSADGTGAHVVGTGVTLTQEGADALQGFLAAGTPLDDFTADLALAAPAPTAPAVTASVAEVPGEGATTVTVTGTGFDPAAATGTRPPLAGRPSGVYVAFGFFAPQWRPSEGAAGGARPNSDVRWAVLAQDLPAIAASGGGIELSADGSFTAELTVDRAAADAAAAAAGLTSGAYGIYTYAGSGAVNASYETFTPIAFTQGSTQEGIEVEVEVPETDPGPEPEGALTLTVPGGQPVSLGTAEAHSDHLASSGALTPVTVTDTRASAASWSLSGQVSDFTSGANSFGGRHLGWRPSVVTQGAGAVAAPTVAPGLSSGNGLSRASVLASAPTGHPLGSASLSAGLDLTVPLATAPGNYTAVLTLTLLG